MIGIRHITSFIPIKKISNYERKEKFNIDDNFIEERLGVKSVSIKNDDMEASDLCVAVFNELISEIALSKEEIEVLIVVTQNPDYNLPHTSAIVHGKLGLPETCACFDISLGCSGYVYGLSVIQSFMNANHFKKGLLFTADPYSKIIDENDKNTCLLFGDAATVTLLSDSPRYVTGEFTFGTIGKNYQDLICRNQKLTMNGRAIFNFAAQYIPKDVHLLLQRNQMNIDEVDRFVFHQGSKYIVNTITQRLQLDPSKVAFHIENYGNTISSSIPIILGEEVQKEKNRNILISGFGVGLSWSSCILKRGENIG